MTDLSDNHKRHISSLFRHVDDMLADAAADLGLPEERLFQSLSIPDATPEQIKVISDGLARFRSVADRFLQAQEIEANDRNSSGLWKFRVMLNFVKNDLEEMEPNRLAGYGALNGEAKAEIEDLLDELHRTLNQLAEYLENGNEFAVSGEDNPVVK